MTDQINAQPITTQVAAPTPREALAGASYVDRVVGGRVFTMAGSETMLTAPHVSLEHSGMVLSGPTALLTAPHLRARHPGMVFLIEPMSGKTMASKERPLILEMQDSLFPPTVEEMLQGQRQAGAAAAAIPAGFVDVGDSEALKAVVGAAQRVERDDAILPIFAHQKWIGPDHIGQLIAVAKRSEHRVALALGAKQGDPLAMKGGVEGYRRFFGEVEGAIPWRTDLAGFDAYAHGARCAVIGQIPSLRRMDVPGTRPFSSNPADKSPHIFSSSLLRFTRSSEMHVKWFASSEPWTCRGPLGVVRAVDSFTGSDEDRLEAHLINLAAIDAMAAEVTAMTVAQAAAWWGQRLDDAAGEYERLKNHTGVMVSMPATLARWRALR
jgi:hypothetical protein